jgi:putative membrane protein
MGGMKSIVIKILVNGVALWVAAYLLAGIHLEDRGGNLGGQLLTLLWVAVIFGLVNAVIKPVLKLLSLPIIILTLGLFTVVVNAAMLQLTSWFAGQFTLAFHVDHFLWDAVIGSIIITVVSMLLNLVIPNND